MWHRVLVAPQHVESSQTRARTRVPCIGRQILNHCATREVPNPFAFRVIICKDLLMSSWAFQWFCISIVSFPLFSAYLCKLVIFCGGILWFPFLCVLWICSRFLLCGYYGTYMKHRQNSVQLPIKAPPFYSSLLYYTCHNLPLTFTLELSG